MTQLWQNVGELFAPAQFGTSQHTLTHFMPTVLLCASLWNQNIQVFDVPDLGLDTLMYASDSLVDLAALHPDGLFWVNSIAVTIFHPASLWPGTHLVEAAPPLCDTESRRLDFRAACRRVDHAPIRERES